MKSYVPRQIRRKRQIIVQVIFSLLIIILSISVIILRYPWVIPGVSDYMESAGLLWDLTTLPLTLRIDVESAVFWDSDLLVVNISVKNNSRFVILLNDLRLVDRNGEVYMPSSTSVYYVTRDQSLWMRQVGPGKNIKGRYAFTVPDNVFGLMFAVDTGTRLIGLRPISEISRIY